LPAVPDLVILIAFRFDGLGNQVRRQAFGFQGITNSIRPEPFSPQITGLRKSMPAVIQVAEMPAFRQGFLDVSGLITPLLQFAFKFTAAVIPSSKNSQRGIQACFVFRLIHVGLLFKCGSWGYSGFSEYDG
jgi:hypothetical protein